MTTYFGTFKRTDGEYSTFVYESDSKKNTHLHYCDFWKALDKWNEKNDEHIKVDFGAYVRCTGRYRGKRRYASTWHEFIYVMNAKNMDEELFDESKAIDLR